jgi:hypothetical protein
MDAAATLESLRPHAVDTKTREISPRGRLILDASFLVARTRVDEMKRVLTGAAGRLLRDGCRVMFEGPWPPYGFSYVEENSDVQ